MSDFDSIGLRIRLGLPTLVANCSLAMAENQASTNSTTFPKESFPHHSATISIISPVKCGENAAIDENLAYIEASTRILANAAASFLRGILPRHSAAISATAPVKLGAIAAMTQNNYAKT